MTERAQLIADRINERYYAIAAAVPPLRPAQCYWLYSDSSESYCHEHAVEARGREFDMGVPIEPFRAFYRRTELEDAFHHGIGATSDGESDSTEHCSVCGQTLSYILTDWGVKDELTCWLEEPGARLDPETVYALDRLCLNVWGGMDRRTLLETATVVGRAYRLLELAHG